MNRVVLTKGEDPSHLLRGSDIEMRVKDEQVSKMKSEEWVGVSGSGSSPGKNLASGQNGWSKEREGKMAG